MRPKRPLPAAEQEVTITWVCGDTHAYVYTSDTRLIERLGKLNARYPQEYAMHDIYPEGVRYRVPIKLIKFGKPASEAMREKGRALAEKRRKERDKA